MNFLFKRFLITLFLLAGKASLMAQESYCGNSQEPCYLECFELPCCSGQYRAGVEWLYWKITEEGLRAGEFIDDFPDPVLKQVHASTIKPEFKFLNGVRGYLEYTSHCDQWGINAAYTYLPLSSGSDFRKVIPLDQQTDAHRQFIVPNSEGFPSFQAFSSSEGLTAFSSLSTKWNGCFSNLDIDLSYNMDVSCTFSLKPHIGFRAIWMTQHLHMEGGLIFPSTNNSTYGKLAFKETFQGYGIEGGVWADWRCGYGFALVGHIGGSILYSRFKVGILSESSIGKNGPIVFTIDSGDKEIIAIPTLDYFVGLKYEYDLCSCLISAHIGWEHRVYFNMNQMAFDGGNLSMQGLTLGGGITF